MLWDMTVKIPKPKYEDASAGATMRKIVIDANPMVERNVLLLTVLRGINFPFQSVLIA
jgi:hypothetical protein